MKKIIIPIVGYVLLGVLYILSSGAPLRVHAVSLAVLAVGFLVPSLWGAQLSSQKIRGLVCILFAAVAMLIWDGTAHFVIVKAEPFSILRDTPWAYLLGIFILVVASFAAGLAGAQDLRSVSS